MFCVKLKYIQDIIVLNLLLEVTYYNKLLNKRNEKITPITIMMMYYYYFNYFTASITFVAVLEVLVILQS